MEITESAVMSDPTRSLAYLQQLPIRTLKIDLSFVREMLTSTENGVIVQSTIAMAHSLGLNVVAEGVENIETLERLSELRCDQAQGYFISQPMDVSSATLWLHQNAAQQA